MEGEVNLETDANTTWCPGCFNFLLLQSVKKAIKQIINETEKEQEQFAMSAGIGCHGKMFDYLNVGGIYSLHGRVLPSCVGMKLGNPNLNVLGFGGDGDTYAEGISHFIHTARYNLDMTMVVHNNQNFALTTGQGTPTSEEGFESKSQPLGVANKPINPLKMSLESGSTFIARVYPKNISHTAKVLKKAILHDGFSHVDVIMPCLIYHQDVDFLDENTYKLEDHDPTDRKEARKKIDEWNYNDFDEGKVPLGILYQSKEKTLSNKLPSERKIKEKGIGWHQVER